MEKKVTKRDYYNQIINLARENDMQEIIDFCEHEIELLDKKKSSGKSKVNEAVNKNIDLVYNELVKLGKATATELIAKGNLNELRNENGVVTTQKISSYLNKLVDLGKVEKIVDKKKSIFVVKEEN